MTQEAANDADNGTRKRLLDKIDSLSQPQLTRAKGALAMIWSGATGLLHPPVPRSLPNLPTNYPPVQRSGPNLSANYPPASEFMQDPPANYPPVQGSGPNLSADYPPAANPRRVELALLKSISTGIFIDLQFYAYNAISNDRPLDPKPLFTSSTVIEEWGSAIVTREFEGFFQLPLLKLGTVETAGIESQVVYLEDGLADDYECLDGELPEVPHEDEAILCVCSLRGLEA